MNDQSTITEPSNLTVIVGLAFTDADGFAFNQAVRIAKRVARSELHLVHVFGTELSEARSRDLIDHLRVYVNEKASELGGHKGMTVGIHIRSGNVVRELVQLATETHADLIVLGSHTGPHLKSWLVGSTAEHLVTAAPCPVLIAAPKLGRRQSLRTSPRSKRLVRIARRLARRATVAIGGANGTRITPSTRIRSRINASSRSRRTTPRSFRPASSSDAASLSFAPDLDPHEGDDSEHGEHEKHRERLGMHCPRKIESRSDDALGSR